MADPKKYVPSYSFNATPSFFPATQLNYEFLNVSQSVAQTVEALKDVRRSDGRLKNGIVNFDALDAALRLRLDTPEFQEALAKLTLIAASDGSTALPLTFDLLQGRPSSLSGYGIADAYTIGQTDAAIAAAIDAIPTPVPGGGGVTFATQAQAEAGTSPAVVMSPLRTRQAIAALVDETVGSVDNIVSPRSYGAKGDGVTDDTAAFKQALAAALAGRKRLYIPAGTYVISEKLSGSLAASPQNRPPTAQVADSLTVEGDGQGQTLLRFNGGANAGFEIALHSERQSVHFRDLAILTTTQNLGTAIKLTQEYTLGEFHKSTFERLSIRGTQDVRAWWACGVHLYDVSGSSFESVTVLSRGHDTIHGIGLHFEGSTPDGNGNLFSIYHDISKSIFNGLATGILYDNGAQGVTISQSNFQNGRDGIVAAAGGQGLAQLNVNDSQFCLFGDTIRFAVSFGPYTIRGNCILPLDGQHGLNLPVGQFGTVIGNQICYVGTAPITSTGIIIGGTAHFVSGNIISGFVNAVNLQPGSTEIVVRDNVTQSITGDTYVDQGTRNFLPGYGLRAQLSSNVGIGSSLTIVPFNNLIQLTGNVGDGLEDGVFTVTHDGIWTFTVGMNLSASTAGGVVVNIQKNATSGAAIASQTGTFPLGDPVAFVLNTGPIPLKKNDQLRVGVSAAVSGGGSGRAALATNSTFFEARRVA